MLPVKIEEEIKREQYREYIAESLRCIGESASKLGGPYIREKWADIVNPKPTDNRTGEEIDRELSEKFGWR